MVEVIAGARLPVLSWAPDLEDGARRQALNCADLPVAFHHVAVMADGHQGYGVPIGGVLALADAIAPYAVGNDIGCGMKLVATTVSRADLLGRLPTRSGAEGPVARDDIMGWVQTAVPAGSATHPRAVADDRADTLVGRAFDAMEEAAAACGVPLSTSQAERPRRDQALTRDEMIRRGRTHLGTLGAGNHFFELLAAPDDCVSMLVHSGSRGVGGLIASNFHRMALAHCRAAGCPLADPGLAWLPHPGGDGAGEEPWPTVGACYERAMRAALEYAENNRRRMVERVAEIVERRFPDTVEWDTAVDVHHNDASFEHHYGRDVWVHRKGAVKAAAGMTTITPGSMGAGTVVGRGLGNPASFESCAHGAGRELSRTRARDQLDLQEELATIEAAGGKVYVANKAAVLDEMPAAYKDLDEVMANQADLVEARVVLRPIGTYKGSETSRRSRRGRWRPAEER